jgi:hypothetical protein
MHVTKVLVGPQCALPQSSPWVKPGILSVHHRAPTKVSLICCQRVASHFDVTQGSGTNATSIVPISLTQMYGNKPKANGDSQWSFCCGIFHFNGPSPPVFQLATVTQYALKGSFILQACIPSLEPIGFNWSYLTCRIGCLAPIWKPLFGLGNHYWNIISVMMFQWSALVYPPASLRGSTITLPVHLFFL